MLHAEQGEVVIALDPEIGDVAAAEHVAVHDDVPDLIAHQVWDEKGGQGKISAMFRLSLALVKPLACELRRYQ